MGDVLIDLGEVPSGPVRGVGAPYPDGEPPEEDTAAAGDRRPRPHRTLLTGLAMILVALLTGAAHHSPPAPPTIVGARLGDMMFVGDDQVLVVSPGPRRPGSAPASKIISGYALPSGDPLAHTTVAVAGPIFDVSAAGGMVLVSYQIDTLGAAETVAYAAGTDRAAWRRPARMLAVSPPDRLALLRSNGPRFGDLTWWAVDLKTGAARWSLRRPVRGFTAEAGVVDRFPRLLVTATGTGELAVRDTITGRVTATARVPLRPWNAGANVPVWSTNDLVLVGAPYGTIAYSLPSLTERWRSPADLAGHWVQRTCVVVICSLSWRGGLTVLDPATGRARWSDDRWNYAVQVGPYLLATADGPSSGAQTVSVLDPATGRVRGGLGVWHTAGPARADGTVVGVREVLAEHSVRYARLDPGTLAVRLLGRAERVAGDCHITAEVLVCRRIDASIGIWPLK